MLCFPDDDDDDEDNAYQPAAGGDAAVRALQLQKREDKAFKSKEQALLIFKSVRAEDDQASKHDDEEKEFISHY